MADDATNVARFIRRWKDSGGSERANYQSFLNEFCDVIGAPRPNPAGPDIAAQSYVYERPVTFHHSDGSTSTGFIDLYKRGCFVLEAKQGKNKPDEVKQLQFILGAKAATRGGTATRGTRGWDDAMIRARGQAESYAKALPVSEGWPPFLIIVDVGHTFELFADFSLSGKNYTQFPDAQSFRIKIDDLTRSDICERLFLAFTDPLKLDPARRSAKVTREIAVHLAELTKSLEIARHNPQTVAEFLMRCLFTMFAEDVGLLKPVNGFTEMLKSLRGNSKKFAPMAENLWATMDKGGFSPILQEDVLRFNGGLFAKTRALPLDEDQLELLIKAASAYWKDVEPAIFGTLLEQALDPRQRHDQGMHYTPRTYVERLVIPTIIEPLREEWEDVKAAAVDLAGRGNGSAAVKEVITFHQKLCETKVLDPACGSGNFLYVTMEYMKRLEGEVLDLLHELGHDQYLLEIERHTVDPHQFLGIEVNPRAAVIAELVLWIGYLQWHFKTRGKTMPAQPVLKNFKNIECRDAVVAYDSKELARDENGALITRWDGISTKKHAATGEEVPDETKRVSVFRYENPTTAIWPSCNFVVGNPPYLGARTIRLALGDDYLEALREASVGVPDNADYVMHWWDHAANLLASNNLRAFGLITTNSIRQEFSRKVIQGHLERDKKLTIRYCIPDHPWVDIATGAAVRVAFTVVDQREGHGRLETVMTESPGEYGEVDVTLSTAEGEISSALTLGANITSATALEANSLLCCVGYQLTGTGFVVTEETAKSLINSDQWSIIRPLLSGRDILQKARNLYAIDLFGFTEEEVRRSYPRVYQWVLTRVKPERDQNRDSASNERWWLFARPRAEFRPALKNIKRCIVTSLTAKHRTFSFVPADVICDSTTVMIALDDPAYLGILNSSVHQIWALHAGGTLEDRPRYNKNSCFDPFPFPDLTPDTEVRIRLLGEQLDKHRKDRQALHPELTITSMYNVLEKLRSNEALNEKDKDIHEKGLVSVLKKIHDDLNAAVFSAYGWPEAISQEEILVRLVGLNHERAAGEKRGAVRWLRHNYQLSASGVAKMGVQEDMELTTAPSKEKAKKIAWPTALPEQFQAVRTALASSGAPVSASALAKSFSRAKTERLGEVLAALVALGKARVVESDKYAL